MSWIGTSCSGDLPRARAGHSLTCLPGRRFLLFGGYDNLRNYNDLYMLEQKATKYAWTSLKQRGEPPTPRHEHTACAIGLHSLLLFGGSDGERAFNDLYLLTEVNATAPVTPPVSSDSTLNAHVQTTSEFEWSIPMTGGKKPEARYGHCGFVFGKALYIFGGVTHAGEFLNDLHILNIGTVVSLMHVAFLSSHSVLFAFLLSETLQWQEVTTKGVKPTPRAHHTMVQLGNLFYVFGGRGKDGQAFNDVHIYNPGAVFPLFLHSLWGSELM